MMKLEIDEVALSLDVSRTTVERWIRQGRIPIRRKGETCRFDQTVMDRWAQSHSLIFSPPDDRRDDDERDADPETLTAAISAGGVFFDCEGDAAPAALRSAVDRLDFLPAPDREILYEKLLERESLASTGVGRGVAIPHPRAPLPGFPESPVIATCFLKKPVHFKAVDDRPVFVMFVLLSPSVKQHLHLLSRLSYCLRDADFVDFLKTRPGAPDLLEKVSGFERRLDAADGRPRPA